MPSAGAPIYAADFARWKCKANQATAQAFAAATFAPVTLDGADEVDDLGIHDPVTNNSRLVIGAALGWWFVYGHVAFAAASAKGIRARITLNGGSKNAYSAQPQVTATTAGFITCDVSGLMPATAAADYVELQGYTDVASSAVVSGDLRCTLQAFYLGA